MPETIDCNNHEIDANLALTDEELAARGFIKIHAYARDSGAKSDNAQRSKRARVKSQESGAKQLNVIAPVIAHGTLRRIAKDLQQGSDLSEVLQKELVNELRIVNPDASVEVLTNKGSHVIKLSGLKRLIAKWKGWLNSLFNLQVP